MTANERLLENARGIEARLDRLMPELTYGSAGYWTAVRELEATRREILALERTLQRAPHREEKLPGSIAWEGRLLMVCVLHSKPGELITPILRQAGHDKVAVCPRCIEDGKKLRETLGAEMIQKEVRR